MFLRTALVLAWSALVASQDSTNPCQSFGIDFQEGGTYFQNTLSNTPFTFVESFEGCQNDTAQNVLVDPVGNQYQCTDTPMMPANTSELSTCPLNKTEMTTGAWSVIIISNNGNADPIAYQRDFSISAGPQSTVTATPTITANLTSTPIHNITLWVTATNYTTLPPQTYTTPSVTITPTKTMTPAPVTVTSMKTLYTVHMTIPMVTVTNVMKTVTATCTIPFRQPFCDKFALITPTVVHAAALQGSKSPPPTVQTPAGAPVAPSGALTAPPVAQLASGGFNSGGRGPSRGQAMPTMNAAGPNFGPVSGGNSMSGWAAYSGRGNSNYASSNSNFGNRYGGWKREADNERRSAEALKEFLERRRQSLAERGLHKRAPDVGVVTVTDSNSADWKTTTQTWIIPTQTLTVTSTTSIIATVTPSPVPVITGNTVAAVVTATIPASTKTIQKQTIAWSLTTKMQTFTMTLTTTMTPSASMAACQWQGGWFWPHGW